VGVGGVQRRRFRRWANGPPSKAQMAREQRVHGPFFACMGRQWSRDNGVEPMHRGTGRVRLTLPCPSCRSALPAALARAVTDSRVRVQGGPCPERKFTCRASWIARPLKVGWSPTAVSYIVAIRLSRRMVAAETAWGRGTIERVGEFPLASGGRCMRSDLGLRGQPGRHRREYGGLRGLLHVNSWTTHNT